MRFLVVSLAAAAVLAAPGAGLAQVTQTYTYDANGRLTGVATSGGAGTHTSAYAYDDADNRTSRSQTGTSAWAAIHHLPAGQALRPGQALTSPDGRYSLALRPSGRMELWAGDARVQAGRDAEAEKAFHIDGDGQARFASASGSDLAEARLALDGEGDLILSDMAGVQLWSSAAARDAETVR